ncbi:hypothetical protein PAV_4c02620 [Paenibacillus alvei DSM 29]|nr:hypothetical protein [Paenibacillus alvei]EJW17161.1 hypothetical protein PAV_4c02620 [Paenibacillus alvei DSM 29]
MPPSTKHPTGIRSIRVVIIQVEAGSLKVEVIDMPHNKPQRIHHQRNQASIMEEQVTPKTGKIAHRAASLNQIPKQQG